MGKYEEASVRVKLYQLGYGLGDIMVCLSRIKWMSFEWTANSVLIEDLSCDFPALDWHAVQVKELCDALSFISSSSIIHRSSEDLKNRRIPQEVIDVLRDEEILLLSFDDLSTHQGVYWAISSKQPGPEGDSWLSPDDLREGCHYDVGDIKNYICIQPSSKNSKWQGEEWSHEDTIREIEKENDVILLGSSLDKEHVPFELSRGIDLRGELSVLQSVSVLSRALMTIGCESWTPVAGALFGNPSILLYREEHRENNPWMERACKLFGYDLLPRNSSTTEIIDLKNDLLRKRMQV